MHRMKQGLAIGLLGAGVLLAAEAARADELADFWRGKTVSIVVGYSAGGGYDIYARVIGRHIGRHIPGNPAVVVNNMPGAGSVAAANWLYNVAPKDGTAFGTFGRGVPMEPLIGAGKTQFDAAKFSWIGSASNELSVCAVRSSSKVKTWDDLLRTEVAMGGEASGSDPDTYALMVRGLFGAKIRLVTGYPGSNDMTLAVERGEIEGRCGWSWGSVRATRPEWAAGPNRLNVLLQLGLERSPILPEVPSVLELAKTDAERDIIKLIVGRQVIGRPFTAPPDIPAARRDALRKAFDETMRDPAFLAEAKLTTLEIEPVDGAGVERLIREIYATRPDVIARARAVITADAEKR